jgi:hypothetical protein
MPFKKGEITNPRGGKLGNAGSPGRPANWFRMSCKEVAARIDLPEFWAKIALDPKERTSDRMEAALRLAEFGEGKAQQSIDITQHNDDNRPSTDALIQTITALRAELDSLREGTTVEAKE